jgi:NADH-quinone oxidoreductase subunit M
VLLGAFQVNTVVAALATTGVVFGAAYMLLLYRRVVFGPQVNKDALAMPDLDMREYGMLALLAALVIWLGVFPTVISERIGPSVDRLLNYYHAQIESPDAGLAPPAEGAQ